MKQIKLKKTEDNCLCENAKQSEIIEFTYKILNPGGNKTAIVIGNDYTKEEKKTINDKILKDNLSVEQVGFISQKENKLVMAGGEFCVNASRCAIWEYLKGKPGKIELNVSGYKNKIIGGITKEKDVFVDLPINQNMNSIIKKVNNFNLVNLDGILLAVISEEDSEDFIQGLKTNKEKTMIDLKQIMNTFKTPEKAVGIILLEKENSKTKINPIIWVKSIDTLYYETACGSGSLAAAIYKNQIEGLEKLEILQPSGYSINISLNMKNKYIENAVIFGKVLEETKYE